MKSARTVLLIIAFLTSGCATIAKTRIYSQADYPPTNPADVEIFEQKPPGDYIEVGEIKVENAQNWQEVTNIFKDKASKAGAESVYIIEKDVIRNDYSWEPSEFPGTYDQFGYSYMYGPRHWAYRYNYPGFYDQTEKLITATGIMIRNY